MAFQECKFEKNISTKNVFPRCENQVPENRQKHPQLGNHEKKHLQK